MTLLACCFVAEAMENKKAIEGEMRFISSERKHSRDSCLCLVRSSQKKKKKNPAGN